MQVPLIDRLIDFQAGFNSLQNPSTSSFPSQITTSIQSVSVAYNFCKWGAVILALVATFGSLINRVTIFIIRFRNKAPSLPSISFDDDDDYSTDDDSENDDVASYSSLSEFEDDPSASSSSFNRLDEFFRFSGSSDFTDDDEFQSCKDGHKRRRSIGDIFSLLELANSKSVVKLWDNIGFGLGLDFDDYEDDGVISSYDVKNGRALESPNVVVSAGEGAHHNLAVEIWDTRLRRRKPSVVAEWGPTVGKNLRVESGGVQKVYVRDDGRNSVMVGDMRKVSTPLDVTESDPDNTGWVADAGIVDENLN